MRRGMAKDLTLYIDDHWSSPYAFSNFVALREKGLDFDLEELSLPKKQTFEADYLSKSLTGRVPALRHGDYWLSESSAINEYLAETFPFPKHPRLFPENIQERGRARQLMGWIRSDLMPIREERPTSVLFYDARPHPLSAEGQKAADRLIAVANAVISEDRTTLFAAWCIADADFALMLNRLHQHQHPLPEKVKRYVEANWKRPSVREWVDHPRKPFVAY